MIKIVLWDVDGTLLDFSKSEQNGIRLCLEEIGFHDCTEAMLKHYEEINRVYWEALERGELSKREVLLGRFETFFREEGIACPDIPAFNDSYQEKLGEYFFENENSVQLCRKLHGRVAQYAVTNGTVEAQRSKLKGSRLGELLDGVFISDEIGVEKPQIGFFEHVFSVIGPVDRREVLIVGDSLTSDMRGGNNAGILCCWYNPHHKKNTANVRLDYEISHLWDVEKLLESGGEQ
ncbi:MAG: noncanonical pyrimidine nucleotidase, YjjG family [Lachnospiraceae bacterium]|jgi:2-haloacid dehalogenase|nr:noncanonical pyrimidine nucleotidase, YjjG family [Lachnospiraceae bacterium]RKJ49175.1 noncanonical pyrimidine nucleotidase, YjjG family [bacterium 1XD42-54]